MYDDGTDAAGGDLILFYANDQAAMMRRKEAIPITSVSSFTGRKRDFENNKLLAHCGVAEGKENIKGKASYFVAITTYYISPRDIRLQFISMDRSSNVLIACIFWNDSATRMYVTQQSSQIRGSIKSSCTINVSHTIIKLNS